MHDLHSHIRVSYKKFVDILQQLQPAGKIDNLQQVCGCWLCAAPDLYVQHKS